MLKLTNAYGATVYVAVGNVCRVDTAGTSSQWHGTRSFVRMFDGGTIECGQDADTVARMIEAEEAAKNDIKAMQEDCKRLERFETWLSDRAGPTLHIDAVREALV